MLTQDLPIEFFVERLGVLSGAISCSVSPSCCLGFLVIFVFVKVGVDIFVLILLLCQVVELKDGSVSSVGAELDEIGAREFLCNLGQDIKLEVNKAASQGQLDDSVALLQARLRDVDNLLKSTAAFGDEAVVNKTGVGAHSNEENSPVGICVRFVDFSEEHISAGNPLGFHGAVLDALCDLTYGI